MKEILLKKNMLRAPVTGISQWYSGFKRKSLLNPILSGIFTSRIQMKGTFVHEMMEHILSVEFLLDLSEDFDHPNDLLPQHGSSPMKQRLLQEVLKRSNGYCDYLSFDTPDQINICQALTNGFQYVLELFNGEYDFEELIENPPYDLEGFVEKELNGTHVTGKTDFVFFDENLVVDWKYKDSKYNISTYPSYGFQVSLYSLMYNDEEDSSLNGKVIWLTPEGAEDNTPLLIEETMILETIMEFSAGSRLCIDAIQNARIEFENLWYKSLDQLIQQCNSVSPNQQEAIVKETVSNILDEIEINDLSNLNQVECNSKGSCSASCEFRRFCSKIDLKYNGTGIISHK